MKFQKPPGNNTFVGLEAKTLIPFTDIWFIESEYEPDRRVTIALPSLYLRATKIFLSVTNFVTALHTVTKRYKALQNVFKL